MDWIKILLTATGSYVALFLITKLIGYRQISEMSIFDYINGITIGSIAAELATELEDPLKPLIAMAVYCALVVLTSLLTSHSLRARRLLSGRTLVLLQNGVLYRDNLRRSKTDINEFLAQCRGNGFFDLSQIELALLENTGKISFLPKSGQRPATPQDLGVAVSPAQPQLNLVVDGKLLSDNLQALGFNEAWLVKQLAAQQTAVKDCFLVTADRRGTLTVFRRENTPATRDLFM